MLIRRRRGAAVEDRATFAAAVGKDRQGQAGGHEQGGQHRRHPGQQVGGRPSGHKTTHAAAAATAAKAAQTTLALLDQDDEDHGDGQNQVNDDKNGGHGLSHVGESAYLGRQSPMCKSNTPQRKSRPPTTAFRGHPARRVGRRDAGASQDPRNAVRGPRKAARRVAFPVPRGVGRACRWAPHRPRPPLLPGKREKRS